jgi:ribosomal protein S18 acetylase RimI-like enzyme
MPEVEIRPALSTEIVDLTQLNHDASTDYVWQMNRVIHESEVTIQFREIRLPRSVRVELPYSPAMLVDEWKDRSGLLVARMHGELVGYIGIDDLKNPSAAWISELAVAKAHRRKGIGTALLLAAQNWAASRRMRSVLFEVQSKNYPGIRLALRLGFEFCGYNDHYYRTQDIALFFTRFLK